MNGLHPYIILLATLALALIPGFLCLSTSYLKVSIVLGMIKNALGTQNVPGTLVVSALSLAITIYVMGPVIEKCAAGIDPKAVQELTSNPQISSAKALLPALQPLREFLLNHTAPAEQRAVKNLRTPSALKDLVTIPPNWGEIILAFMLSELRQAFTISFMVLLPFLIIDIVISTLLAGLGMYMVSPTTIALPLKLILFVGADGWVLLMHALINSYGAP